MHPILELKNVSFTAPGTDGTPARNILQGIDLIIPEKSIVVVTGPNGSGKSTLAKVIMGIVPPSAGTVRLGGEDITALDVPARAKRNIGFAFQQPVRFKGLLVRDLLQIAAGKRLDTDGACRFLSEVGLCAADYVDRELDASLSGGELKRIEIATVLARQPRLAIFDEPEAGIDLWSFGELIRVFEHLRDNHDSSLFIISHQERLLRIADTIVVLDNGRIVRSGGKEDLLPSLPVESCGCGVLRNESRRVFK